MSGSSFGKIFTITTWGESHGKGLGVVVDGCPAGIPLCEADIQPLLDRRKPGTSKYATHRSEEDQVQILSGVFEGITTGTPISLMILNQDQRSKDYSNIQNTYRPGHADFCYDEKYGFRDYRGGGRSSGRETVARVAAGGIAKKILAQLGIDVCAYTHSIGTIEIDPDRFERDFIYDNALAMPDRKAFECATTYLDQCMKNLDSAGGVVECVVNGMMPGVGDPVFDKLDAQIGKALFSIGAVKAVEFGAGVLARKYNGSKNNDAFYTDDNGTVCKRTNHAGGILGGMSDGTPVVVRATFKPTASIYQPQQTINKDKENVTIQIEGRHDPIIVARAVVVVESMVMITLVDLLFSNVLAKIDTIKKAYGKNEVPEQN